MYDGKHDLSDHGAIEAEPDRKADHGRNRYQHQIVADVIEPGEFEIAEQLIWLRCIDRIDAPDQLGDVFKDQKHGIGHQQQHHFVAAVKHFQEAAFQQKSDGGRDQRHRKQHGDEANAWREAARGCHGYRGCRDIGAEGVEAAMGDVEDLQYAEYQR